MSILYKVLGGALVLSAVGIAGCLNFVKQTPSMDITESYSEMEKIFQNIPDDEKYIVLKYGIDEIYTNYYSLMSERDKQIKSQLLIEQCDNDEECLKRIRSKMNEGAVSPFNSASENAANIRGIALSNFRNLYLNLMLEKIRDFENSYSYAISKIGSASKSSVNNSDIEGQFDDYLENVNSNIDLEVNEIITGKFNIFINSSNDHLQLNVENKSPYNIEKILLFDKKSDKFIPLTFSKRFIDPGENITLDYDLKNLSNDNRYILIALDYLDDSYKSHHVVFRNTYLPVIAKHIVANRDNIERMPGYSKFVKKIYRPKNIHGEYREQEEFISHTFKKLLILSYEWSKTVTGTNQQENKNEK